MPDATLQIPPPAPLTSFTEDEIMFRDNIRQFADEKVRPLVKEMDEKGVFDQGLIRPVLSARADGNRNSRAISAAAAASSLKRFWRWRKCRESTPPPES